MGEKNAMTMEMCKRMIQMLCEETQGSCENCPFAEEIEVDGYAELICTLRRTDDNGTDIFPEDWE